MTVPNGASAWIKMLYFAGHSNRVPMGLATAVPAADTC